MAKKEFVILTVVIVAACCGALVYFILSGQEQSSDTIKIGLVGGLGGSQGDRAWQEVLLAVEQVNADGGVLGRNFEAVAEDTGSGLNPSEAANAITRLITIDEADFILSAGGSTAVYQEIIAQYKKILFDGGGAMSDNWTQKVLDDYDKYKYYFRTGTINFTSIQRSVIDRSIVFREYTGLNKVALIGQGDVEIEKLMQAKMADSLREEGFDVVYNVAFSYSTIDFTSYFVQAEAAGAEMTYSIFLTPASIGFVNEYATRQSPMIIHGVFAGLADSRAWELTYGGCEYVCVGMSPTAAGYRITSKTIPFIEAFMARWNQSKPTGMMFGSYYDVVRYILPDAIERAGTIETDAVIQALEETSIETSLVKNFVFTTEHDIMVGENPNDPDEDYWLITYFQWQDGELVPVYPKKLLEEAGATFKLPDWPGPWD